MLVEQTVDHSADVAGVIYADGSCVKTCQMQQLQVLQRVVYMTSLPKFNDSHTSKNYHALQRCKRIPLTLDAVLLLLLLLAVTRTTMIAGHHIHSDSASISCLGSVLWLLCCSPSSSSVVPLAKVCCLVPGSTEDLTHVSFIVVHKVPAT